MPLPQTWRLCLLRRTPAPASAVIPCLINACPVGLPANFPAALAAERNVFPMLNRAMFLINEI